MIGITAYGTYVPEGAQVALDEDVLTMAVAAVESMPTGVPAQVDAVYFGSEYHPYAVKSTAAMLADWFGWSGKLFAADLEFACKAGTSAMQVVYSMLKSEMIESGIAVGSDCGEAEAADALAKTVGAGAAAFVLGKENLIAEIVDTISYCTDTPDFWRHQDSQVPRHAGRFTGEPAYFKHMLATWDLLSQKNQLQVDDVDYFIFHQPNPKFPKQLAERLGIAWSKLEAGFVFPESKNAYSATTLLGLAKVLDVAKPGEKIVLISYGSGAGSDAFYLVKK